MEVWPLRFRAGADGNLLFSNEAGSWFRSTDDFLDRYVTGKLTELDAELLLNGGHSFRREGDLHHTAYLHRWLQRHTVKSSLNYVMLVPTLRCNLSCDYCQVSRAAQNARGFDWTDEMLGNVLSFLGGLDSDTIKIEFQGGEPLLRLDHLRAVRAFCRSRFERSHFVVCSNFQVVDLEAWEFFADEDTSLSTSLDGPLEFQARRRTHNVDLAAQCFANIKEFVDRFGPGRINALPTIDIYDPPDFAELVDTYLQFGLTSIYLRPINRQGFARRTPTRGDEAERWAALHSNFIDYLVARNAEGRPIVEEYYFSHALRRVLRSGETGHVDLRNPNPVGLDYVVIDENGTLFPTDEARMMARVGQFDLSVGHVATGIDRSKLASLNFVSFNDFDPDCRHCAYQPFCGVDRIDDISRYGRVDLPRHETWFCRRHLALFDKLFELITSSDAKVQFSMAKWAGLEAWPSEYSRLHS